MPNPPPVSYSFCQATLDESSDLPSALAGLTYAFSATPFLLAAEWVAFLLDFESKLLRSLLELWRTCIPRPDPRPLPVETGSVERHFPLGPNLISARVPWRGMMPHPLPRCLSDQPGHGGRIPRIVGNGVPVDG